MESFLWVGSSIGAVIGLIHGVCLFKNISTRTSASKVSVRSVYYALWTFILWTIFGSYVLFFWLVGVFANLSSRMISGRNSD